MNRILGPINNLSSKVVQIVYAEKVDVGTTTTVIPFDDTLPQNTEGSEFLTLSISPLNAANILHIDVQFHVSPLASDQVVVALFQDSTADALAAGTTEPVAGQINTVFFRHRMIAGTIASTTFKVRAGAQSTSTLTINGRLGGRQYGGALISFINIIELRP
jgi:hypothetical protein